MRLIFNTATFVFHPHHKRGGRWSALDGQNCLHPFFEVGEGNFQSGRDQGTNSLGSLHHQHIKAKIFPIFVEVIFRKLLNSPRGCCGRVFSNPQRSLLGKEADGKALEIPQEEGGKKKPACSWDADGYITNRHGRPPTQWNKETSGETELFNVLTDIWDNTIIYSHITPSAPDQQWDFIYFDTNGCSTGCSLRCFGKNHTITRCFLSSNHIPGAAGRWGGLNRPPAGFRDAPTQENQATPLARLQTPVSNTNPRLKADSLLLQQRARGRRFLLTRLFVTLLRMHRLLTFGWISTHACTDLATNCPFPILGLFLSGIIGGRYKAKSDYNPRHLFFQVSLSLSLISFLVFAVFPSWNSISYQNRSTSANSCTSLHCHLSTNQIKLDQFTSDNNVHLIILFP